MRPPFLVSRLSSKGAMDQNYSWTLMMNYLERQELEARESEPHRFDKKELLLQLELEQREMTLE